jgi:predicted DsbA family dithiol-disulfide isomerase
MGGDEVGDDRFDFWFDFADPGSYLVRELLGRWIGDAPERLGRMRPLELRPPPGPPLPPHDPGWEGMVGALGEIAREEGIPFAPPAFVPWTRKAHELALHAGEKGMRIHPLLFRARFVEALDLGRVDVLVGLAERAGLDAAEARTVLGVDRFAPAVEADRDEARAAGVRGVPTLVVEGGRRLEGFRSAAELQAFARDAGLL